MKANFITKDLLSKLNIVGRVVSGSKVSRYKTITITADDSGAWLYGRNAEIEVYARIGAKIIEPGQISVLGDYLWKTVKTYPKEARIEWIDSTLTCNNFNNVLAVAPSNVNPWPIAEKLIEVPDLLKAFGLLNWADKVFVDNGYLVGGNRGNNQIGILAGIDLSGSFYIAKDFITTATNFNGSCHIQINENNILFQKDDYVIVGSIREIQSVPPYKTLLPTTTSAYFEPPAQFVEAVQNADNTTRGKAIDIAFANTAVRISGNNPDVGDSDITLPTKIKGQGNLHIYAGQLLNVLTRANQRIYQGVGTAILQHGQYTEILAEVDRRY